MDGDQLNNAIARIRHWIGFIGAVRLFSAALSTIAVVIVGWFVFRPTPPPIEDSIPMATLPVTTTSAVPAELAVHVAGAVASPGVYRLPWSSRVVDAVNAAGGALPQADLDRINLAQVVFDNEQVYIPRRATGTKTTVTVAPRHQPTTTVAAPSGGAGLAGSTPIVNINRADADQLVTLPGIGPATAKAIITYREQRGGFSSVEDLVNVPGIGTGKLAAIRDLVTVS